MNETTLYAATTYYSDPNKKYNPQGGTSKWN